MNEIKPIETEYKGYRFRSRLEARWAVFFDAIGVEYEYEPEGFQLPSGRFYLPDFRLKCWGTRGSISERPFDLYVEVKGEFRNDDLSRIAEFSHIPDWDVEKDDWEFEWDQTKINPVLIVGNIPEVEYEGDLYNNLFDYGPYFSYEYIDGDQFGAYPSVKNGKFFLMGDDCNYLGGDYELLIKGYQKARKARFEHGEKG